MFGLIAGMPALMIEIGRLDRFGGDGYLAGTLPSAPDGPDGRARILNVPARIDITVLEPITHEVVARTWSRPDGSWRVPYLSTDLQFTIIGTDRSGQVNSAIQDWIYPAPMVE
jgi:hypothetical protein